MVRHLLMLLALCGIPYASGAPAIEPQIETISEREFAFDLDGHGQPIWGVVDAADFEPQVLRAYVALLVLKCTSSAIRHCPADVLRQLDRAERVLERYGA